MKKQIIITNLFLLISFTSFAQYDIKDFLNYKQPDLNRHELSFLYDLQNNYSFENINDSGILSQESSDFHLHNNLNSTYQFNKNTRKYIGAQSFSVDAYYNLLSEKLDSTENKNNYFNLSTSWNSFNRFYFRDNLFYNLNFYSHYSTDRYTHTNFQNNQQTYSNSSSNHEIILYSQFSIGIGRVEPLIDVIHAIVYIKTLNKKNRITTLPDTEGIMEFAKLLAETKNKRFLDSRHKKIYELEKIDSFLSKNNYINNNDIKYFTGLEDIWVYAGNYERNTGNTFSVNFQPVYSYFYSSNNDNYFFLQNDIHELCLAPSLSFTSSKPVNVLIQRNISLNVGYHFLIPVQNFGAENSNLDRNLFMGMNFMYGFYPNTRTVLESSLSVNYNKEVNFYGPVQSTVLIPVNSMFRLNCYYYISPKIRIFLDTNFYYYYINYKTIEYINNRFNYSINAGFELIIF